MFRLKDDGQHKARLVVRGCAQNKQSMDYEEIYSPVVDTTSLRLMLALASKNNWHVYTLDVKTAFLYGDLDQEINIKMPEGFTVPGKICLLKKSLYGLRQAPCNWNKKLSSTLQKLNMVQLKSDPCIFRSSDGKLILGIHVDDGIIIAQEKSKMKELEEMLKKEFEVKVDENPKSNLGMEIQVTKDGINLSQDQYTEKVLKKFEML